ncbi:MAG: riboflavin synthase subunit alpha [Actinobacteria bacterium RBG_16_67_10]|nr:MAG: riboflavin synthase subunit alpha [Actinobacteria bacterium RBG_16_67_10]
MFTGIVRELGTVVSALDRGADRVLAVHAPDTAARTNVGDSVAVNGCCLTADAVDGDRITFHAVSETLARTTLGSLQADDRINLEAALRAGEPLGGHYVQGHVDGVGRVQSVEAEGEGLRVFVEVPDDVLRYCVEKGSVTVDGVSLTIAEVASDAFGVALVPHTLEATTLSELEPGQEVNIEADVLAKYVERALSWSQTRES